MFTMNFCKRYPDERIDEFEEKIGKEARFWIDRLYGEAMVRTAGPERMVHLEQVLANDGHMAGARPPAPREAWRAGSRVIAAVGGGEWSVHGLTVFLDDGGVMNDNRLRGPAWQRLVAEYFIPRLGGASDAWAAANVTAVEREMDYYRRACWGRTDLDAVNVWRDLDRRWLRDMCEIVGVAAPADDDECIALAEAASASIIPRVNSAFPGAAGAIRALHARGYRLHTASGERSTELHGYLTGMGVRDCFGRLYGPDLVRTLKEGPAYYARILADAGVNPARALVVDDTPRSLRWAAEAGARTLLVGQPTRSSARSPASPTCRR